jgi:enoyl-CoA hydratase
LSGGKITVEQRGYVLLMGLNRPEKRNAFDVEMYQDLAEAYGRLDRDRELRCGLLFAHGGHFTAGLDLVGWATLLQAGQFAPLPPGGIDPLGLYGEQVVRKPVVMAAQGYCLTIGLELLLAADVRVAASDTSFAQIEVKRGFYAAAGATIRLPQEIGWGGAMRYLLTGDEISAAEAFRLGLVQAVTAPGEQLGLALKLAESIARQAPLGVQATLQSARLARLEGDRAAAMRLLPELQPVLQSEDAREGYLSFMERREAVFKGK